MATFCGCSQSDVKAQHSKARAKTMRGMHARQADRYTTEAQVGLYCDQDSPKLIKGPNKTPYRRENAPFSPRPGYTV